MGGTSKTCWIVAVLIMLAMGAAPQEAAPLSLPEAVKITLANNRMHRAALAATKASAAGVREARSPAAAKDYVRRELYSGQRSGQFGSEPDGPVRFVLKHGTEIHRILPSPEILRY